MHSLTQPEAIGGGKKKKISANVAPGVNIYFFFWLKSQTNKNPSSMHYICNDNTKQSTMQCNMR